VKIISKRARAISATVTANHEWLKCEADPIYFIESCVKRPAVTGNQALMLWQPQMDLIDNIQSDGSVVVAHCRQAGITTTMVAYLLWSATFEQRDILVVIPTHSLLCSIMRLAAFMHDNLPAWVKPVVTYSSARHFEFANGSSIYFQLPGNRSVGMKLDTVYLADFAFIDKDDQLAVFSSVAPNIRPGGSIIVTSTPARSGDIFHEMFRNISTGVVPGIAQTISYFDLPHSTPAGWARLGSMLSADEVARELGAEFV
jgi:hypothetical protein